MILLRCFQLQSQIIPLSRLLFTGCLSMPRMTVITWFCGSTMIRKAKIFVLKWWMSADHLCEGKSTERSWIIIFVKIPESQIPVNLKERHSQILRFAPWKAQLPLIEVGRLKKGVGSQNWGCLYAHANQIFSAGFEKQNQTGFLWSLPDPNSRYFSEKLSFL